MPVEDFDKDIDELSEDHEEASRTMLELILLYIGAKLGIVEAEEGIDEISQALKDAATEWVEEVVPAIYADGVGRASDELGSELRSQEVRQEALADAHDAALELLIDDLAAELAATTDRMRDDAKSTLREIARRQVGAVMDSRQNPRVIARDMESEMRERGVSFTDRRGRRWNPRGYSEMVLRTHATKINNTAHLNTAGMFGSPGVFVSDGGPGDVDEPCKRANGQSWSLGYAAANLLEHPNCRRSFASLPSDFEGPLDRE